MNHLEARSLKMQQIDLRLRQYRGGAFVLAALASVFASRSGASGLIIASAGLCWILFGIAVAIHLSVRRRSERLAWRLKLGDQLKDLKDLKFGPWLASDNELVASIKDQSARRLLRDLDLAGAKGFLSLFPFFLSIEGRRRFLSLMLTPVKDKSELCRRQEAVQFWQKSTVIRRKILRLSSKFEELVDWSSLMAQSGRGITEAKGLGPFALVLGVQVLFLSLWALGLTVGPRWLGTAGLVSWIASYVFVLRKVDLVSAYPRALVLGRGIRVLREVAIILERLVETGDSQKAQVQRLTGESSPVQVLAAIERASGAMGLRQNPILALLVNFVFPWDLYWALKFESARRTVVEKLPGWFEAMAEVECFLVLAEWNVAHGKAWPEWMEGRPTVQAEHLAHPLLPQAKRVANSLDLGNDRSRHLVTGSNMAGKSTFLRAIGLNLLLAQTGAMVTAKKLSLSPLRVETSMRPADSLADGFSSFYAEVSDLVEITKFAEQSDGSAVLFLIDEIFRGTNNRERRIGAEAVIRALSATSAIGLITTHDLDLASLEGSVPGLENHHFRDSVKDGLMTFSYEYQNGPCPSTNAIKVMRGAGLRVPEQEG